MQRKELWIVAIFLFSLVNVTYGLKCYVCSTTENESDKSCADDVLSLGKKAILDCNKNYCTIARLDYLDPKGKLASITRGCADKVDPDYVQEDTTFRTYFRSCKTNLCNSGTGRGSSVDPILKLGDKSTIMTPGTAGGVIFSVSLIGLLCCLALIGLF